MINEVKRQTGPVADKFPTIFSDASILRFLRARNWNTKKTTKMLKETLKWQLEFKPEKIRWEDIAHEAETGKVYRANYFDKQGRSVVIMRPGFQNSTSNEGQIRCLVYCMEKTIMAMQPGQEQMVWLIDFQGWNISKISVKVSRETARVLQNRYPERLAVAILYNPPKVFESFMAMVKPLLEQKTFKKVKFVYSNDPQSIKIMESLFDMDKVESAFGGKNTAGFDCAAYAKRMKDEDKKMSDLVNSRCMSPSVMSELQQPESVASDEGGSEVSDEGGSDFNDEMMSILEGVDEKIGEESISSKDVANVDAAKELKLSENA